MIYQACCLHLLRPPGGLAYWDWQNIAQGLRCSGALPVLRSSEATEGGRAPKDGGPRPTRQAPTAATGRASAAGRAGRESPPATIQKELYSFDSNAR